jgi:capsular exopolysaccharide synthesis family protein
MGYVFDAMQRAAAPSAQPAPQLTQTPREAIRAAVDPIQIDPRRLRSIDERLVIWTDQTGLAAEEYRAIRTGLLARWQQRRHLTHAISSAVPQEGKTITSLNLAASVGELQDRTCVAVEADLRLPQFRRMLGLAAGAGLTEVLRGEATLDAVLVPVGGRNVWVLPAGSQADAGAAQLLSSHAMSDLLSQLKRQFDHVVLDTPPVNAVADAGVVSAMCDEVMLVARTGSTPAPLIERAARALKLAQANVSGLIATGAAARREAYRSATRYQQYHTRMKRAA